MCRLVIITSEPPHRLARHRRLRGRPAYQPAVCSEQESLLSDVLVLQSSPSIRTSKGDFGIAGHLLEICLDHVRVVKQLT